MAVERDRYSVLFGAKDKMSGPLKSMGGSLAKFAGGFIAFAAVTKLLKASIQAAAETQKAYAQLAGTVKRAGVVWESVSGIMRRFTGEMQNLTGIADETFSKGIQMFIDYGFSGKEAFRLVRIATDIAISRNEKLERTFKFLTEAAGNSAISLKKYGVTLDLTQTNAEQFADAMNQVEKTFSGAAAAQRDTATVQFAAMSESFGDMLEAIGKFATTAGVVDVIKDMTSALSKWRVILLGTDDDVERLTVTLNRRLERQKELLADIISAQEDLDRFRRVGAAQVQITFSENAVTRAVAAHERLSNEIIGIREALKLMHEAEVEALDKIGLTGEAAQRRFAEAHRIEQKAMLDLISDLKEAKVRYREIGEEVTNIVHATRVFGPPTPGGLIGDLLTGLDGPEGTLRELTQLQARALGIWDSGTAQFADGIVRAMGGAKVKMGSIFTSMANDFARLFIQRALQELVGVFVIKMLKVLALFDKASNDRFAMKQGQEFAGFFTAGAIGALSGSTLAQSVGVAAVGVPALAGMPSRGGDTHFHFDGPVMTEDSVVRSFARKIERLSKVGATSIVVRGTRGRGV